MSMNIKFYLRLIVFTLLGLVNAQWAAAQNVTIKATNGSMIASVPEGETDYDTFFKCGGFATWQHEQLSMAFTASDETTLTSSGQLKNPANNLFSDGTHIQIGKGYNNYPICYLSLSLPKGYRFTGYTIKLKKLGETSKRYQSGTDWWGNPEYENVNFNTQNTSSTFGETGSDFDTYINSADVERGGDSKIITRTSQTAGDMDNVLYFKLYNKSNNEEDRALIELESAEFFFTAEADYAPLTTPGNVMQVSAIDIPFTTSKVDYGTIQSRTYNGATRVSYSSANVKDLMANFTLYEAESVKSGADFDGVTGDVVEYKEGSISVEDGYYRIGDEDETEHIYYIETPSYVLLSDQTTKNPVGYRIVGAKIDYKYGKTNTYGEVTKQYSTFYISYTSNRTYYMNITGGATRTQGDGALWFIDSEGYIRTGVNGQTYLTNTNSSNGDSYAGVTTDKSKAVKFSIDSNGRISYTQGETTYWLRNYTWGRTHYFRFQNDNSDRATRTNSGNTSVKEFGVTGTADAKPYTLKVYDKTGTQAEEVEVTSGTGSVYVAGMNNDAVKIGVIGTGLIQGTLTLQALDPYLNSMEVVCQDKEATLDVRISQTFTASDFSVNGGEFYFYLPGELKDKKVGITFENLKSDYFDNTYTGGSSDHNSRINFVKSAHYDTFGTSNNNIYNSRPEAADASKDRLSVGIVGTAAFKFNNAEDLSNSDGILTEYPFSLENYAAAPNSGTFTGMEFTVSEEDQNLTRYVFTTDETRYNIAPTTAVQHRAYAYYKMIVHVMTATYEPKVKFDKVYSKSLYYDNVSKKDKEDAFYGVTVTAPDNSGEPGYASINAICDKIATIINTTKKDDFNNTDLPSSTKQILYLDLSQMGGVFMKTDATHQSMSDFTANNAVNNLMFLPEGSSASSNNVAYKTAAGTFRAANNIVLTDKQPFYSKYDIQVGDANYATYTRNITWPINGKSALATVMLPFTLLVTDGEHTEPSGSPFAGCKFTLNEMKADNCLSSNQAIGEGKVDFQGRAHFVPISGSESEANVPYMVNVTVAPDNADVPFAATQFGALVKATTTMDDNYHFMGESAKGTIANTGYTFQNKASFSGKKLEKATGYFYFAGGKYLNSTTIAASAGNYLYVYPFRGYYTYSTSNGAKHMTAMDVFFGENDNEATGVHSASASADLVAIPGKGVITFKATSDNIVQIVNASGISVGHVSIAAGETRTVQVPSGLYVVNGAKMIVK